MRIKRLTATILAVVMLMTTCCSLLLSCADDIANGNGVYTITFNANGGVVSPTAARTTEGKLTSLPTPYKENTEFLGWYLSSAFAGEPLTVNYKYSFSCLIHAKWGETQATEYTVTFDPNGGTLAAGTEAMMTVNSKLLAFPSDPTPPANHSFSGWYTQKQGGDKVDTAYEFTNASKNVTVYAQYAQEYVITYDPGVGTIAKSSDLTTNGRLMGGLPTPTGVPEDMSFVGWYTKQNGGKRVNSATVFTSDCTIYALYLEDGEFIITLDANGGTLTGDIEEMFTKDAKLGELPTPTPPKGHEFGGWFTAPAGGEQIDSETVFYDNDTIYAQYVFVEFYVSFDANGGTLSESTTLMTVDKKLERLPYRPFAPAGYMFVGWYTERIGGEKVDLNYVFTGPSGTRMVYAHYDVAVIRDDGLWVDSQQDDLFPQRGVFSDLKEGEIWAYDINLEGGVALEIWYQSELIIDVTRDDFSTDKVILTPDKMLRLAEGADIGNSIINVAYRFNSKVIYIQEIVRADIQSNDGAYIGKTKQKDITQNIASSEIMVENLVIATGGTKELNIVLSGKVVEIAHFGMDDAVKAQLSSDKKNIIIAAGTYSLYYNYGVTDTTSPDYKNLWITGRSTGDLPATSETISPYYLVGSSATLGLTWNTIASASLIPENIHFKQTGSNTYEITVDLYEGNQFKICKAGDGWDNSFNYQNLDGNTGSNQYFKNSNDIDGNKDYNIVVSTNGNYTLTINTSTNRLTFVRNGEAASVRVTYDIYIHGSYTSSWQSKIAASNKAPGTVTFEYTFTAGLEFGIKTTPYGKSNQIGWAAFNQVVTNNTNGGIVKATSNTNLTCKTAGTYRFTLTLDNSGQVSSIKIDVVI